jgi:hypothetical protein
MEDIMIYEIPDSAAVVDSGRDLVSEASTLGLKPGQWPVEVGYEGIVFSDRKAQYDREGDLYAMEYSHGPLKFFIYND